MNIVVVDDERPALRVMERVLKKAVPESELFCFTDADAALACAREKRVDIAFLDIEMSGVNGLALAKAFKDIEPKVNIIFVTGYSEYMGQAIHLRASGYLMKPITVDAVRVELENLRYPIDPKTASKLYVQCFGHFEVYVDGQPLHFERSKAKELFAFLIDRQGASVNTSEIAAVLWEDRGYNQSLRNNITKVISSMLATFRGAGLENVFVKSWNNLAVDTRKLSCDYYELLNGDARAINRYAGEYMSNYSWAEFTAGALAQ